MDKLTAEILYRLAEKPDYAYSLRQRIEQIPDGMDAPNATFYRRLRWLLKNELIDEIGVLEGEDERRQYYRINASGERALGGYAANLVDQLRRLQTTVLSALVFAPTEIYIVVAYVDGESGGVHAVYDSPELAIAALGDDEELAVETWANTNTGKRVRRWVFYFDWLKGWRFKTA